MEQVEVLKQRILEEEGLLNDVDSVGEVDTTDCDSDDVLVGIDNSDAKESFPSTNHNPLADELLSDLLLNAHLSATEAFAFGKRVSSERERLQDSSHPSEENSPNENEGHDTTLPTSASADKAKMRRRSRRAKDKQSSQNVCNTCNSAFETRNQLFNHISTTDHGLRLDSADPQPKQRKKRA